MLGIHTHFHKIILKKKKKKKKKIYIYIYIYKKKTNNNKKPPMHRPLPSPPPRSKQTNTQANRKSKEKTSNKKERGGGGLDKDNRKEFARTKGILAAVRCTADASQSLPHSFEQGRLQCPTVGDEFTCWKVWSISLWRFIKELSKRQKRLPAKRKLEGRTSARKQATITLCTQWQA